MSVDFTEIKCEGFSAGSSESLQVGHTPITDGKFQLKLSDGELSGQFTSPTTAEGTIHLLFQDLIECGTWEWSATGQ